MNAHDWTRAEDGIFHDFHQTWTILLKMAIRRLLPPGFYVAADQRVSKRSPDVMALHASAADEPWPPRLVERGGALAVAEAPPREVESRRLVLGTKGRSRTLSIRHTRGHRVVVPDAGRLPRPPAGPDLRRGV